MTADSDDVTVPLMEHERPHTECRRWHLAGTMHEYIYYRNLCNSAEKQDRKG